MSLRGHRSRLYILHAVTFLALLSLLAACGDDGTTKNAAPTPTPTAVQMVNFDLGIPKAALNSPVVGNLPDSTPLHINVTFKSNEAVLSKLDTQKVKKGNQTDVSTLANQLGITDQQYQQIKSYFGIQDAKLQLSKLHTNLSIDAKAGSIANLLHTKFVYHQYQGRKFFAPSSQLQLPKSIADSIIAIQGLDNYTKSPTPGIHGANFRPLTTTGKHAANANCTAAQNSLLPQEIRSAYGYDSFWKQGNMGSGTTVILPELAAFNTNDVQNYLNCIGYRGKLTVYNVAPAPDPNHDAWGGDGQFEATLDIEMVAGMAPYANIEVYQTDGSTTQLPNGSYRDPLHDVFSAIIDNNTKNQDFKVVSISWGQGEGDETQSWMMAENSDLQYMTRTEYMTVFVASGDCGAYEMRQYPGPLSVSFPSSSPYAVGVGGTQLAVGGSGSRASEVVWSDSPKKSTCDNTWGSGGGVSQYFAQPKWQTPIGSGTVIGTENGQNIVGREVPDISAVATNIAVYADGQWEYAYGTSAATPIWAAGWCLLNQMLIKKTQLFFYGPSAFYSAAKQGGQPFFDIEQGNNLHYSAQPGRDLTSGLGAPNLPGLYNALYPLTKQ